MLIANPIYDTVFKYLMDNTPIAKGIIATIIGEEIVHLELQSQESHVKREDRLSYYYLDFIAKIKQKDNSFKTVLIELQKSSNTTDLLRFRRYLGEQYKKEESVMIDGNKVIQDPLPLITIYILGYSLSKTLPAVIKISRQYLNLLDGGLVVELSDFIERLTHDAFIIQLPGLKLHMKNRLEYVLSVFKQDRFIDDDHRLKDYDLEVDDDLMKLILKRLSKAAADKTLLRQLEVEELADREYDNTVGKLLRAQKEIAEIHKLVNEKEQLISEKEQVINEKEQVINETKQALSEKDKYIAELLKRLEKEEK